MSLLEKFGATAKQKLLFILGVGLVLLGTAGLAYSLLSINLSAVKAPTATVEQVAASLDASRTVETSAMLESRRGNPMVEAKPAAETKAWASREESRETAEQKVAAAEEARKVAEQKAAAEEASKIADQKTSAAASFRPAVEAAAPAWTEKSDPRAEKAAAAKISRVKLAAAKRDRLSNPSRAEHKVQSGRRPPGGRSPRDRVVPMLEASRSSPAPSELEEALKAAEMAPPPVDSPLKLVDEAIRRLTDANVAFNSPPGARLGKDLEIVAKLSVKMPKKTLVREVEGLGTPTVAPLKVSDRVIATLTGGGAFDISPDGPQEQAVSENELTIWSWKVTPKAAGEQTLILTFDSKIRLRGEDVKRTVRTLTQKINVEVGWPESAGEWLEFVKKQLETVNGIWIALLAIGGAVLTWARKISPVQSEVGRKALSAKGPTLQKEIEPTEDGKKD